MGAPAGCADWSAAVLARTEAALDALLPPATGHAPALDRLHEAMRYAVLEGGKRVRPLLAHAAGELTGARPAAPGGLAIEPAGPAPAGPR